MKKTIREILKKLWSDDLTITQAETKIKALLPSEAELLTMLIVELQSACEDGKSRKETAKQLAKVISERLGR